MPTDLATVTRTTLVCDDHLVCDHQFGTQALDRYASQMEAAQQDSYTSCQALSRLSLHSQAYMMCWTAHFVIVSSIAHTVQASSVFAGIHAL